MRTLVGTGVVATLAAMLAATAVAASAKAAGVDLEVAEGEVVPVSGIAVVTGFFSLVGVAIAVAVHRWSARPVGRFVAITVSLTAVSLVPPVVAEASTAVTLWLIGVHLVAASVMIPALAWRLRRIGPRVG